MDPRRSVTFLYQQHAYITSELARVNNELSSLTSKKARLDQLLEGDPSFLRAKKRKMKQSRYLTIKSLEKARREQDLLVQNLRAIDADLSRLTAPYPYNMGWIPSQMQYYTPSPIVQTGVSVDITSVAQNSEPLWPVFWDQAMMQLDQATLVEEFVYPREIAQPETQSMESFPSRPDSGFEEPALYMMPFDLPANYDTSQHVYAHETFHPQTTQDQVSAEPPVNTVVPNQIFTPPISAVSTCVDEDTTSPWTANQPQSAPLQSTNSAHDSPTRERPDAVESAPPIRRYSEAAVQLIERRLNENQNEQRHNRNKSSGHFSTRSGLSIGSSTYSPVAPAPEHRASVTAIAEGLMGAVNAELEWLS